MFDELRARWEATQDYEAGVALSREMIRRGQPLEAVRFMVDLGDIDFEQRGIVQPPILWVTAADGEGIHASLPLIHASTGVELRWYSETDSTEWARLWSADIAERAIRLYAFLAGQDADGADLADAIATARRYAVGMATESDLDEVRPIIDRMHEVHAEYGDDPDVVGAVLANLSPFSPYEAFRGDYGWAPLEAAEYAAEAAGGHNFRRQWVVDPDTGRERRMLFDREADREAEELWQAGHLMDIATGVIDPRTKIPGWKP